MARKQKIISIEGHDDVIVREVTVGELLSILDPAKGKWETLGIPELLTVVTNGLVDLIPKLTNVDKDKLLNFTPSEIEVLITGIKEVNGTLYNNINTLTKEGTPLGKLIREAIAKMNGVLITNLAAVSPNSTPQDTEIS